LLILSTGSLLAFCPAWSSETSIERQAENSEEASLEISAEQFKRLNNYPLSPPVVDIRSLAAASSTIRVFRFHISQLPNSLNPQLQRVNSGNYLIHNLFRSLMQVDANGKLIPDLAESCRFTDLHFRKVECVLRKNIKWSDGSPLRSGDFLASFKKLLDPDHGGIRSDLLFDIDGAEETYLKTKKGKDLGIKISGDSKILFSMKRGNPEFIWNLANTSLAPIKDPISSNFEEANKIATSGPFSIESYFHGKGFLLRPNSFYWKKNTQRPSVEVLVIPEEQTALILYEKKGMDFLRRFPSSSVEKYQSKKDFFWTQLSRLDHIALGPSLHKFPHLRRALASSLNFDELSKLLYISGAQTGCPGVPQSFIGGASVPMPCLNFNLTQAKKELQKEDKSALAKLHLNLYYSSIGGNDPRRTMEWMRQQWKNNLGLEVQVRARENKTYLEELKNNPPSLFRKGVSPERNTCSAFLEIFSTGHIENSMRLADGEFDKIVRRAKSKNSSKNAEETCLKGLQYLLNNYYIIPLGSVRFPMLLNPDWIGVQINPLNQLNLEDLAPKSIGK